jgi:transcription initiation factor IIE alpha subunit
MELCDDGHDEVCYESRNCPVCQKIEEIDKLKDTISELEDEIERLNEEE